MNKSLVEIFKEMIGKLTAKQAFITILTIAVLVTGVFVYKDFNDTKVEIIKVEIAAKLEKSAPAPVKDLPEKNINRTVKESKIIKAKVQDDNDQ